jgi:hypothetical protein
MLIVQAVAKVGSDAVTHFMAAGGVAKETLIGETNLTGFVARQLKAQGWNASSECDYRRIAIDRCGLADDADLASSCVQIWAASISLSVTKPMPSAAGGDGASFVGKWPTSPDRRGLERAGRRSIRRRSQPVRDEQVFAAAPGCGDLRSTGRIVAQTPPNVSYVKQ